MLADEAHHLNTDTNKKGLAQQDLIPTEITGQTSEAEIEKRGWEHTVIDLILNKNYKKAENKNVLLEFTATIPANESIVKNTKIKLSTSLDSKNSSKQDTPKKLTLFLLR